MLIEHEFIRDEVFPSWYANALGRYLSLGAFGLTVARLSNTTIEVVAGADEDAAIVAVAGRWRWMESTVTRVHPGGSAGTYDIYVTARETDIEPTPAPYTDNTDYSFALAIVAAGATPTIVAGSVEIFRKIGSLQWDGTKITRVNQTVPALRLHATSHAVGGEDPLLPADIGAAAQADLTAEIARAENAETVETAARTSADSAEATTRAAADNTLTTNLNAEIASRISANAAEATARQNADRFRVVHVANIDSESSPSQSAGAIIGFVPVSALGGGEGWTLVGVVSRAMVGPTGTASVYKVQTDHGSSGGVLSDVAGLTSVTPATGRALRQGVTGGSQALSDLDTVALVLVTPGTTKGIGVALEFERTHS